MKKSKIIWKYSLIVFGLIFIFGLKKDNVFREIDKNLGRDEAMIFKGMVWGEKINNKEWNSKMINSGLVHLVVVSGANLMIVMWGVVNVFSGWINRKSSIVLALILGWWYIFFTGWQISSLRAIILMSLILLAQILGRKFSLNRAIIFTLIIIFLIDRYMIFNSSFWLSFGAFFGSITGSIWWKNIWITLWIMPILWIFFGYLNLIMIISGFLVLNLSEVILVLGLISLVGGKIIFWIITPLLKYFLWIIEILGSQYWLNVSLNINLLIIIGWYMFLIGFSFKNKYELYK